VRLREPPKPKSGQTHTPAGLPVSWPAIARRVSVSANHGHDVPSATSDVPSATSNPNDGDGYACGDAGGPSPFAPSASPGPGETEWYRHSRHGYRRGHVFPQGPAGYTEMKAGGAIYRDQCSACHGLDGTHSRKQGSRSGSR
jgi:hypothetical protein